MVPHIHRIHTVHASHRYTMCRTCKLAVHSICKIGSGVFPRCFIMVPNEETPHTANPTKLNFREKYEDTRIRRLFPSDFVSIDPGQILEGRGLNV
jgi:hypothetical protein